MSGRSRHPAGRSRTPKSDVQRIRVDAQGYDDTGAYWGAGPDVFIISVARLRHHTAADGADEVTVRAGSVAEARRKVAAELARRPGEPRSEPRPPLGGASPHKSRYQIDWRNPVNGEAVRIRITHSRDYLATGSDHIEVESIRPKRAPLPITETGYRSHFMPALELVNAGGPVVFVTSWIERETKSKAWTAAAAAKAQGDLFQWADARGEIGARRKCAGNGKAAAAASAQRHDGKPSRRRKPLRDRTPE